MRPREKLKEIQPSLKFKLFCNERLKESLYKQRKIFNTSLDPESTLRLQNKNYQGIDKQPFCGGKSVYGYYHYKIHFKTIESVALDLHSSIRNASRQEIAKERREECLGFRYDSVKSHAEKIAKEEIMPMSSEVLERYGIWKEKSKSKTLTIQK